MSLDLGPWRLAPSSSSLWLGWALSDSGGALSMRSCSSERSLARITPDSTILGWLKRVRLGFWACFTVGFPIQESLWLGLRPLLSATSLESLCLSSGIGRFSLEAEIAPPSAIFLCPALRLMLYAIAKA